MSFSYKIIHSLFKILRVNKMLDKEGEEFKKLLEEYNKKQKKPLKIPLGKLKKNFFVEEKTVGETKVYSVIEKIIVQKRLSFTFLAEATFCRRIQETWFYAPRLQKTAMRKFIFPFIPWCHPIA